MTATLLVLCALSSAVPPPAPTAAPAGPARFAIVVGDNGPGTAAYPRLAFADDDAARMYQLLSPSVERAWLHTTFDNESAFNYGRLSEQARAPAKDELSRTIGEAFWAVREARDQGRPTELWFFFAGHGDVDPGGEGRLILGDGALTRAELAAQVTGPSPADVTHVVIDACASFFMVPRGSAEAPPVKLTEKMRQALEAPAATDNPRVGYFVSTSTAAQVHESASIGGGLFSFLLRSALSGAADTNGDAVIEYTEGAAFVTAANQTVKDTRAHLDVYARPPAQRPHAPLMDLTQTAAEHFLYVDINTPAPVEILDGQGLPLVAFHREKTEPVLLTLAGSSSYVVRVGDREAIWHPRSPGAYALSALDFNPAPVSRAMQLDVFEGLFAAGFGPAYLSGFTAQQHLPSPLTRGPFTPAFAPEAAPAWRVPWWTFTATGLGTASLLAAAAAICVVGNGLSLAALRTRYEQTGTFDGDLAFMTDAWLTAAGAAGAASLVALVASGGLMFMALQEEDTP